MVSEHGDDSPLIFLANFASAVTVDLGERDVVRRWSAQAPRKMWLSRPGDVLITPVPLSDAFVRYASGLLGMEHGAVDIVVAPDLPDMGTGEAVGHHGLTDLLRSLAQRHPGTRLLPTILDAPSVALAAALGVPVSPFARDLISPGVVHSVTRLNTKSGFRRAAEELGIRIPEGRACEGSDLPRAVSELLACHERVVVKADRSAGGHGLRFLSHDDPVSVEPQRSSWVVERFVRHTKEVSVMCLAEPTGPRILFTGEMRTRDGAFIGYRSPLCDVPDSTHRDLERWGLALGRHLGGHGYQGPYSIDALVAEDGTLYATESNVRRTATTTPHAMVTRLSGGGHGDGPQPAWLIAKRDSSVSHTFPGALKLLDAAGLSYTPGRGEGVVLYADRPAAGSEWRYAVIGSDPRRTEELEDSLVTTLRLGGTY
ncbi:hypothetical protein QR77_38615 [Streptomyces sp. 150FB]|uniref:preATP grasp domain-containing protein n=1 Tax=Streptomyces sp. 150FB TaxID=1576605 RepID=UPI000589646E|nr:peptide ligase PGM1-related protein [Streptomyces sp. 150FB]KIF78123.1 hypothetical protein QR77_38615 [Streptomyces sp. 150FB]